MSKTFTDKAKEAVAVLLIGLVAVAIATFVIKGIDRLFSDKKDAQIEQISQNVQDIKNTISPYEHKDTLKKIEVVSNFQNSSKNGEPTKTFQKDLIVRGNFSEGFLYIKGSVNEKALGRDDDVYIKLNSKIDGAYKELGGHLISSRGLETPTSDLYTEILFPLSDIKYKNTFSDSDFEATTGDWLNVLNSGGESNILGFSSTLRNGNIIETSIYYACSTGSDCSIEAK